MEPILKKEEIASLLAAINEGTVPLDLDGDEQQSTFLDSTPIDLFNLSHINAEQSRIPNFDIILDIFCRTYAGSLSNKLQRTFSITRTSLESFEFQNFFKNKSNLGASGIIDLAPLKNGALIVFDPKLSFSLIEIMLGASIDLDSLELDRKLTTIELLILKSLIIEACKDLDKAFSQLLEIHTSLIKLENNPRLVSIVEPQAEVIVSTFLVEVGELSGEIHLVFPFVSLEPLRDLLKEFLNLSTAKQSTWHDVLHEEVQELPAVITAQSGTLSLSVSQLMNIKKGDILSVDYDPDSPLKILVEGQPTFYAVPGTHNGKKAISLTGTTM